MCWLGRASASWAHLEGCYEHWRAGQYLGNKIGYGNQGYWIWDPINRFDPITLGGMLKFLICELTLRLMVRVLMLLYFLRVVR